MTTKAKTTYQVELLDGTVSTFKSTLDLAWAVVVEDSRDRSWSSTRHGIYFRTASREAASRKATEARSITGDDAFARVEIRPVTRPLS